MFFLLMRHFRIALTLTHNALIAATVEWRIMGIDVFCKYLYNLQNNHRSPDSVFISTSLQIFFSINVIFETIFLCFNPIVICNALYLS